GIRAVGDSLQAPTRAVPDAGDRFPRQRPDGDARAAGDARDRGQIAVRIAKAQPAPPATVPAQGEHVTVLRTALVAADGDTRGLGAAAHVHQADAARSRGHRSALRPPALPVPALDQAELPATG